MHLPIGRWLTLGSHDLFLQIGKPEKALSAVDSAFMFLDESLKTRTFVNAAKANALIRVGKELEAIPFF